MRRASLVLFAVCAAASAGQECGTPAASHPPNVRTSGDRIESLTQGIVGGGEAAAHSYPWMAKLSMGCGGALISDQWLVTAAHCFDQAGGGESAYLGVHKMGPFDFAPPNSDYRFERVEKHPGYINSGPGGQVMNDIALVKLKTRFGVRIDDNVRPICLPDAGDDYRAFTGNALLAGWGGVKITSAGGGGRPPTAVQSAVLKHLLLTADAQCDAASSTETRLCARGTAGSSCVGDSGGPLAVLKGGKYTLVGVVSYGPGDCAAGSTEVYTHVPAFRDWIKQVAGL